MRTILRWVMTVAVLGGATAMAAPEAEATSTSSAAASVAGPAQGKLGLRFSLQGGGVQVPAVGLRFFASDALALDLDAGLSLSHVGSSTTISFGFGAAGQYYFGRSDWPVRPFGLGRLTIGWVPYGYFQQTGASGETLQAGVSGGAGLEYWPVPYLSVSGAMAAGVSIASVRVGLGGFESTQTVFTVGTVSPSLAVTLYTP